jgi:uncharacterized membrane protein YjfL (UPF0719 family)
MPQKDRIIYGPSLAGLYDGAYGFFISWHPCPAVMEHCIGIYVVFTPHNESKLECKGNVAAGLTLGAVTIPNRAPFQPIGHKSRCHLSIVQLKIPSGFFAFLIGWGAKQVTTREER